MNPSVVKQWKSRIPQRPSLNIEGKGFEARPEPATSGFKSEMVELKDVSCEQAVSNSPVKTDEEIKFNEK